MPTYRIVYIDDDTFAPRTLTAAFPNRTAVEIAMASAATAAPREAQIPSAATAAPREAQIRGLALGAAR